MRISDGCSCHNNRGSLDVLRSRPRIFYPLHVRLLLFRLKDAKPDTKKHKMKKRTAFPPSRRGTRETVTVRLPKTKVRSRKFIQKTDLTRREFSRDVFGTEKPNNKAKTEAKQHQNKHDRHRYPKTKVRSRKFSQKATLRKEERKKNDKRRRARHEKKQNGKTDSISPFEKGEKGLCDSTVADQRRDPTPAQEKMQDLSGIKTREKRILPLMLRCKQKTETPNKPRH